MRTCQIFFDEIYNNFFLARSLFEFEMLLNFFDKTRRYLTLKSIKKSIVVRITIWAMQILTETFFRLPCRSKSSLIIICNFFTAKFRISKSEIYSEIYDGPFLLSCLPPSNDGRFYQVKKIADLTTDFFRNLQGKKFLQ